MMCVCSRRRVRFINKFHTVLSAFRASAELSANMSVKILDTSYNLSDLCVVCAWKDEYITLRAKNGRRMDKCLAYPMYI